jgi:hypothetical protein
MLDSVDDVRLSGFAFSAGIAPLYNISRVEIIGNLEFLGIIIRSLLSTPGCRSSLTSMYLNYIFRCFVETRKFEDQVLVDCLH